MTLRWARVYDAAARILYADSVEPLVDLGRDMALSDLTGIYKVLLRVATIPMVIERTARLWTTYHKKGSARIEREGDAKKADLIVVDGDGGVLFADGSPERPFNSLDDAIDHINRHGSSEPAGNRIPL